VGFKPFFFFIVQANHEEKDWTPFLKLHSRLGRFCWVLLASGTTTHHDDSLWLPFACVWQMFPPLFVVVCLVLFFCKWLRLLPRWQVSNSVVEVKLVQWWRASSERAAATWFRDGCFRFRSSGDGYELWQCFTVELRSGVTGSCWGCVRSGGILVARNSCVVARNSCG